MLSARVIVVLAALCAAVLFAVPLHVAAASPERTAERIAYCFDLLIKDPQAYSRRCASGAVAAPPPGSSLVTLGTGTGPASQEPDPDPCANGGVGGNAGNAGNAGTIGGIGGPCDQSSNRLAPFLMDLIEQVAMMLWPPVAAENEMPAAS